MTIRIYTDGACSKNGYEGAVAGWGFVAVLEGEENKDKLKVFHAEKGAIPDGTNNVGELTAILNAIKYALKLREDISEEVHFVFYSDSAYCINGITDWRYKWKRYGWWRDAYKTQPLKNKELWISIDSLIDTKYMSFKKCEGHSGDRYNDYADTIATEAVKEYKNGKTNDTI